MERRTFKVKGSCRGKLIDGGSDDPDYDADTSVTTIIRNIVRKHAIAEVSTASEALLFLQSWWSRTYSRPLKDPLLQEYTYEELVYEYFDHAERIEAEKVKVSKLNDIIEDKKDEEVLSWADEEEKREREEEANQAKAQGTLDDQAWMQQQIAEAKKIHGDDFGEDLNLDFNE